MHASGAEAYTQRAGTLAKIAYSVGEAIGRSRPPAAEGQTCNNLPQSLALISKRPSRALTRTLTYAKLFRLLSMRKCPNSRALLPKKGRLVSGSGQQKVQRLSVVGELY